jgi:hypothetical protein
VDTSQQVSRLPFRAPFLGEICNNARFISFQDRSAQRTSNPCLLMAGKETSAP